MKLSRGSSASLLGNVSDVFKTENFFTFNPGKKQCQNQFVSQKNTVMSTTIRFLMFYNIVGEN